MREGCSRFLLEGIKNLTKSELRSRIRPGVTQHMQGKKRSALAERNDHWIREVILISDHYAHGNEDDAATPIVERRPRG